MSVNRPSTQPNGSPKASGGRRASFSSKKRQLPPPTGVMDFFSGVAVHACRKYLFSDMNKRIVAYMTLVLIGSLIGEFVPIPRNFYLAQKTNILNLFFVKLGWGWTCALVGAFVYLTSNVYSGGDVRNVRQQCARLIIGTIVWYFCTSSFVRVEQNTARCSLRSQGTLDGCTKAGGRWLPGFDISGHCFLLIYCLLFIQEELKVFRKWDRLRQVLELEDEAPELAILSPEELGSARALYKDYTPKIRGLFMAITLLHFIWELMLTITVLYYHTLPHKLLGAIIAVAFWVITYRVWYKCSLSPGMPGHCKIRYTTYSTKNR